MTNVFCSQAVSYAVKSYTKLYTHTFAPRREIITHVYTTSSVKRNEKIWSYLQQFSMGTAAAGNFSVSGEAIFSILDSSKLDLSTMLLMRTYSANGEIVKHVFPPN